ncbi:Eco57I restriction-modification methylase domain-containing protein, partial [Chloroflexota bacterium]
MNLLLKDLDHPTSKINVVEGNSLEKLELTFDLDIYETEHPLSSVENTKTPKISLSKLLKNRPFDIIVSNPPYIFTRSMAISESEKGYYKKHYKTGLGKVNTFTLFIEAGIERLAEGGKLGFIVPNTILRVSTYEPLRDFILENCAIEQIVDLGKGQFDRVTAET